jgi:hypothetical protein
LVPPKVMPVTAALVQGQGFAIDIVDCHGINVMVLQTVLTIVT